MEVKYLDFLGNELQINDFVIYSNGAKDKTMRVGQILELDYKYWTFDRTVGHHIEISKFCVCVKGKTGHIYEISEFGELNKLSLVKYIKI